MPNFRDEVLGGKSGWRSQPMLRSLSEGKTLEPMPEQVTFRVVSATSRLAYLVESISRRYRFRSWPGRFLSLLLAFTATFSLSAAESDERTAKGRRGPDNQACAQTDPRLAAELPLSLALLSGAELRPRLAEAPEFIVDRPDVSESSFTVAPGFWQAELGLRMNRQHAPRATGYFFDDLFRIGVRPDWELRLGGGGLAYREEHGSKFAGLAPFYAGVKYHFLDENHLPSMGLLLNANLPSPSHRFSNRHVDGNVLLVANKSWGPIELEPNIGPGAAWDSDARAYFPQFVHATTLSYYPVKSLRFYVELFGALPGTKNGMPATSTGVGIHWYDFRKNIAIDLSATRGLSRLARDGNDWSVSVGFSFLR
jgi:hypothetical protein